MLKPKAVVFLDQSVLSNMAKALHRGLPGHSRAAAEPIWLRLFSALDVLVRAQLVVCPEFETHRTESMASGFFAVLKRLYGHLAGGVRFARSLDVLGLQLVECAEAEVAGRQPDFAALRSRAIVGDLTAWIPTMRFAIVGHQPPDIDAMRARRAEAHEVLTNLFLRWKATKASFLERFDEESGGLLEAMVATVTQWQQRNAHLRNHPDELTLDDTMIPPLVRVLDAVATVFARTTGTPEEALRATSAFFASRSTRAVPYLRTTAAMYAALATRAPDQTVGPNRGTFNDLTAIATVGPLVDILVVDNGMASLIKNVPASHRPTTAGKVFSKRSFEDLALRLESMLREVTPEHAATLARVYGEWRQPRTGLFGSNSPTS